MQNERDAMVRRERALLTGMFTVRNHIATRLQEYEQSGKLSRLKSLRTAQAYVQRLIDKAPGESEGLMIAVVELGLKLDSLMACVDVAPPLPAAIDHAAWLAELAVHLDELKDSLEQFDILSGQKLEFLTDEDLARYPTLREEDLAKPGEARG